MGEEAGTVPERPAPTTAAAKGSNSDDPIGGMNENDLQAEHWLSSARNLIPAAIKQAKTAMGFAGKWKLIVSKLERLPSCLSDLSSHPFFSKNSLCKEQLQSVCRTLSEVIELAGTCADGDGGKRVGKLQMQSDLDAVSGKLDLNIRDCKLLVKSGVLGEVVAVTEEGGPGAVVRELFARLQIGHVDAKYRAVEGLLELLEEDEKSVLAVLGRSNVAALAQLLAATTSPKIREKTAAVVCILAESRSCDGLLVSEGVLPPLLRLADSGGSTGREKAVISLQRLSMSAETAKLIVGRGGARPLVEICSTGDSISQAAAAGALKNLSTVPEVRQTLADEGIIGVMLNLLEHGVGPGSKEQAAECLQNLTSSNESLRRAVVAEGGIKILLSYVDGPSPQESAVVALRNLAGCVPAESLVTLGLLPTMVRVLQTGSAGARHAAASTVCKISNTMEMKRLVGEWGCVSLLVGMLESKSGADREVAAQALSSLMCHEQNAREVKKQEKSVASLVQLLDHSPQNTAKKYAVSCLLWLSRSRRCRKSMVSHGAIGYLKKLVEMDVPAARKLLERLQRGKFKGFFTRK